MWPFARSHSSSERTTPKQEDRNPFDMLGGAGAVSPQGQGSGSGTTPVGSLKASSPVGQQPLSPSARAFSFMGPAGHASSSSAGTISLPPTPGVTPGAGPPTTSLSLNEPDFTFKVQPSALGRRTKDSGSAPKGRLSIKLIAGRDLASPSPHSRPYVVASFDQNEFVSREPIDENEREMSTEISPSARASPDAMERSPPQPPTTSSDAPNGKTMSPSALAKSLEQQLAIPGQHKHPRRGDSQSAYNPTWKHEVLFDVINEKNLITLQVYDRSSEEEAFLGGAELRPKLIPGVTIDEWFDLAARPGETATGAIRVQIKYEKFDVKRGVKVSDFDFLRMIGRGTFGRVFQVRKKDTRRIYAMKVLSKREIVAKKEIAHTIGERKILQRSSECPFLLGLKFSFQSETDLYLVMDYKSGGELFHHLQREGRFTEDRARFYTAEIVLAFEHLHKFDIVYRDLKPENILLDATGHIVLCDFGLSKPDLGSDELTNTFCGTTEYLAPEVLLDDHGYSKLVDFWSLGVLLFEMCCGWSPFYAEDTQQMYKLICFGKVKFPRGVIGEDGKQFVKGLLNRNPKHRLGAQRDAAELKEHPFFKQIDWAALAARMVPPPFKPSVDSDESVANFDTEFTQANLLEEAPSDAVFDDSDPSADWINQVSSLNRKSSLSQRGGVDMPSTKRPPPTAHAPLTNSVQENFRGFTFSGEPEFPAHHNHHHGMTGLSTIS